MESICLGFISRSSLYPRLQHSCSSSSNELIVPEPSRSYRRKSFWIVWSSSELASASAASAAGGASAAASAGAGEGFFTLGAESAAAAAGPFLAVFAFFAGAVLSLV